MASLPGAGTSRAGELAYTTLSELGNALDPNVNPADPMLPGVIGNIGDIYQSIDGGVGTTLYIKEAGDGTNTGWQAK